MSSKRTSDHPVNLLLPEALEAILRVSAVSDVQHTLVFSHAHRTRGEYGVPRKSLGGIRQDADMNTPCGVKDENILTGCYGEKGKNEEAEMRSFMIEYSRTSQLRRCERVGTCYDTKTKIYELSG